MLWFAHNLRHFNGKEIRLYDENGWFLLDHRVAFEYFDREAAIEGNGRGNKPESFYCPFLTCVLAFPIIHVILQGTNTLNTIKMLSD